MRKTKYGENFFCLAKYSYASGSTSDEQIIIEASWPISGKSTTSDELEAAINELDSFAMVGQYDTDGTIIQVNIEYQNFFGFSNDTELQEKNFLDLICDGSQDKAKLETIMKNLIKGESYAGTLSICPRAHSPVSLQNFFLPILGSSGRLKKILHIAHDKNLNYSPDLEKAQNIEIYSEIVKHSDKSIIITDVSDRILFTNPTFSSMFGYSAHSVKGKYLGSVLSGNITNGRENSSIHCLEKGKAHRSSGVLWNKDQQRILASVIATPIFATDGTQSKTIYMISDNTDLKFHANLQTKILETIVHGSPISEVLTLLCQEAEAVLPGIAISISGYIGNSDLVQTIASPSMPEHCVDVFDRNESCLNKKCVFSGLDVVVKDLDQWAIETSHLGYRPCLGQGFKSCWVTPIRSSQQQILGSIAFYSFQKRRPDNFQMRLARVMVRLCALIMERESNHSAMEQISQYDAVSGLPNRQSFIRGVNKLLSPPKSPEQKFMVIIANMDRFTRIGETLGHRGRAEAIHTLGQSLRQAWAHFGIVACLGGDEFAIGIPTSSKERSLQIIQRTREILSTTLNIDDSFITTSAGLGISLYPDNGENCEALIYASSLALSTAKRRGQDQFEFFKSSHTEDAILQLDMESALIEALCGDEFSLYYQPQIYIDSKELYGVEALARWDSAIFGSVSPGRFIPIIEKGGLIDKFSVWVIHEACKQMAEWKRTGVKVPSIAINLSALSFHNDSLIQELEKTVLEYGLSPQDIILELTEGVLLSRSPETFSTIYKASKMGFRFALDDFGTGYSSLSYLQSLPISEIKLDRVFVNDVDTNNINQRLSQAVIGIGTSLELNVAAEGIETAEQLRFLQNQGYTVAQGFFFAGAMPPADIANWLEEGHKFFPSPELTS